MPEPTTVSDPVDVLMVEDQEALASSTVEYLTLSGVSAAYVSSAEEAHAALASRKPKLVLLDVNLPGLSGFEFCRRLRRERGDIPIVFVSARTAEDDQILALSLGGDDYIAKPYSLAVLLAKIRRMLDRLSSSGPPEPAVYDDSWLLLDLALTRDVDEAVRTLTGVVHLDLPGVRDAVPDAEAQQVDAARAIVDAEADDFERTLAGRSMDPLITALRSHVGKVVTEEIERLRPLQSRLPASTVPSVDGRADVRVVTGGGVVRANGAPGAVSATAIAVTAPETASEAVLETLADSVDEPVITLAQAERALHHLAARLLHQPTVMARRAGQDGHEDAYRQALELVLGLNSVGETHD